METLEQFTQYLLQQHQSKSTIKQKVKVIKLFLNFMDHENLKASSCPYNDIMDYIRYCQNRQGKAAYIKTTLNALNWYFKYLVSVKCISINPVKDLKIKGVPVNTVISVMKENELEELYLSQQQLNYSSYETMQRDTVLFGLIVFQALQL